MFKLPHVIRTRGLLGSSIAVVSLLLMFSSFASFAQQEESEDDPWAGIEEMLVVGSGDGAFGLLGETSSVTEFGADDLAAYGIENTSDLAAYTPNLEIVQNSATTATFFIRGVGLQDFSANATGAVAVYLDGVPLNVPSLQVAPIFDAGGVEVLKGPQGRGNYRNATAGIISIRSNKPDLASPFFSFNTTQGSIYSVDAIDAYTRSYETAFSIPVVPDILATRFAFKSSQTDPIYTNRCGLITDSPGVSICGEGNGVGADVRVLPSNLNKEVGNKNVFSLRSSWLLAPPTDVDLEVLGIFYFSRRDQDGNFGQAIGTGQGGVALGTDVAAANGRRANGRTSYREPDAEAEVIELGGGNNPTARNRGGLLFTDNFTRTRPLDRHPFTGDFNKNGLQRVEIMGGSLNMSMEFGSVELSMTAGASRLESEAVADTDYVPDVLFEVETRVRATQASVDLVLNGELESIALSWEFGGFFLKEDLETVGLTDLAFGDNFRFLSQDIFSYGVFAGFDIDFLDDFTFSAGARLNNERKQFDLTQYNPGILSAFSTVNDSDELTWREPTGTVQLSYRFSESTSVYFKFNHGFKPGHYNSNGLNSRNGPFSPSEIREPAKPELIDAFEIGLRASYFDDRFKFEGAVFYYNYKDYQVFVFEDVPNGPPTLQVINANDAQVMGAEVDIVIEPLIGLVPEAIEGLKLNFRGGWLDSTFLDFQSTSLFQSGPTVFEVVSDYTGNSLLNSPRFTVSGGFEWTFLLGKLGEIIPRYDFSWTDDQYYDPTQGVGTRRPDGAQLPEFTLGQRAFVLHNVRMTYRPPDSNLRFSGWCRNVADERYKQYAFDVSRFRGVVINFVGDPRTCGADIAFTF